MATKFRVFSVDFDGALPLSDVLKSLAAFGARIVSFDAAGSSGGNPLLDLEFGSVESARGFLERHFPDGPDDYEIVRAEVEEEKVTL